MLLRRVIKHVKNQNWFAVLLDFVIVVVGVFIGIQVSNWNDARVEHERENEILSSIVEDLKKDREELKSSSRLAQKNIDASNIALSSAGLETVTNLTMPVDDIPVLNSFDFEIQPPPKFSEAQLQRLWSFAVVRYHPIQSDAAFGALMAAGDLALIKDSELVRELQLYHQLWQSLEIAQNVTYRPFRNQLVFMGQEYGLSPFGDNSVTELNTLLSENPDLASALRTMAEYSVIHKSQIDRVDLMAANLLDAMNNK